MNIVYIILTIFGVGYIYRYNESGGHRRNQTEPLILTYYLNRGEAELARQLSRVEPFAGNIQSHSGFFRVSDDCVRNMFFWYFPAQNGNPAAPLLVWLQGGPGASSNFGLFTENGPYYVDGNQSIHVREKSWTRDYSVLFIDNPVGVGFSFSSAECYVTTETQVGLYLSILMDQFFQLFPGMRRNPLYITGESYAGKYVPAMVDAIHEKNQDSPTPLNLAGMVIGNGLSDPYHMVDFGTYLNKLGLIFDNQIVHFDHLHDELIRHIEAGNYMEASLSFDATKRLIRNLTGLEDIYDYYADFGPINYYAEFVSQHSRQLNAGDTPYVDYSMPVRLKLYPDRMMTVAPTVARIINAGYKTLFYSGQFDIIVPYPLTSSFLGALHWNGKEEFAESPQRIWREEGGARRVYGYVRAGGNVMQVIVRNAGHMVPLDQPEAALDMLRNFIYGLEF